MDREQDRAVLNDMAERLQALVNNGHGTVVQSMLIYRNPRGGWEMTALADYHVRSAATGTRELRRCERRVGYW